jgi:hypothetical protein
MGGGGSGHSRSWKDDAIEFAQLNVDLHAPQDIGTAGWDWQATTIAYDSVDCLRIQLDLDSRPPVTLASNTTQRLHDL